MKNKKWIIIISSIIVISFISIGIVIGRIVYMHNEFNNEMIRIANSEKANKVYRNGIKLLDKNSFTKNGVIKSYKIEQSSISHNQMGGIDVTLMINNDKKLTLNFNLDSSDNGKNLNRGGLSSGSEKLDTLLEKNKHEK